MKYKKTLFFLPLLSIAKQSLGFIIINKLIIKPNTALNNSENSLPERNKENDPRKEALERIENLGAIINTNSNGPFRVDPYLDYSERNDIDLSNLGITDEDLGIILEKLQEYQCYIVKLDLSRNKIERLPDEIGNMKCLETFILNNNQITDLPNQFQNLKKLKTLNFSNNCLETIPEWFVLMNELKDIDISYNSIVILNCLGKNIEHITAFKNKIEKIDDRFSQSKNIKTLNLSKNYIEEVPNALIVGEFKDLIFFTAYGNEIEDTNHHYENKIIQDKILEDYPKENGFSRTLNIPHNNNNNNKGSGLNNKNTTSPIKRRPTH
jgi:hypothetical protein